MCQELCKVLPHTLSSLIFQRPSEIDAINYYTQAQRQSVAFNQCSIYNPVLRRRPALSLMVSCCHFQILSNFLTRGPMFIFYTANSVAGPDYTYFTRKETEAPKCCITCPRSQLGHGEFSTWTQGCRTPKTILFNCTMHFTPKSVFVEQWPVPRPEGERVTGEPEEQ